MGPHGAGGLRGRAEKLKSVKHYDPVERALSDKVSQMAREQGVSPETLVNLWIQEKVGPSGS